MASSLYGIPGHFDVIVIGGGPAGATTAALLARDGHQVLVLERERFPRYHIGESLIPVFMPAMAGLGLTERMDARFERKYGGTLIWGNRQIPWNFSFTKGGGNAYAYHARRADLDALILDRARELGAHILEEATVKDPLTTDPPPGGGPGRVCGVRYTLRGHPGVHTATARLIIDASGQARVISRRYTDVTWHNQLRNVAIWTYYDNCHRLPGDQYTNILIEGLDHGWFWAIPITPTTMSVGYVTSADHAATAPPDELFTTSRDQTTILAGLLNGARQSAGYRTARDWSYTSTAFHGNGWAAVGDAAAFVDPLFSTGVALATLAATALAKIITTILAHPHIETPALNRYATAYHNFFNEIRTFVERFYDRTKYKEYYWDLAQEIVDPEKLHQPATDFVTLISGLSGKHPLFNITLDDLTTPTLQPATT
jgi:flavin-dependent dehydrogenase